MKPKNFPGRKNKRREKAIERLNKNLKKVDKDDQKKVRIQEAIDNTKIIPGARSIRTKKVRGTGKK